MQKPPSSSQQVASALHSMRKKYPAYQNHWMSRENWLKLIILHYGEELNFKPTLQHLGVAIKNSTKEYDITRYAVNEIGFYKANNNHTFVYCSMSKNERPKIPPGDIDWDKVRAFDAEESFQNTRKRFREVVHGGKTLEGTPKPHRGNQGYKSKMARVTRSSKQNNLTDVTSPALLTQSSNDKDSNGSSTTSTDDDGSLADETMNPMPPGFDERHLNYWNSSNAEKDFGLIKPRNENDNEDVRALVEKRIKKMKSAYQTPGGWRNVLEDRDSGDCYSTTDIFQLRWKCRYLSKALDIALISLMKKLCSSTMLNPEARMIVKLV
mmetsp:Transcript_36759/g.89212  ORF Transcript_36759/g.89212 Transcript_36759/m.89212 type:complete len:323 (+) Transcript_36759:462-1430(+)